MPSSARAALKCLGRIFVLKRPLGGTSEASFADDHVLCSRLRMIQQLLNTYTNTERRLPGWRPPRRRAHVTKKEDNRGESTSVGAEFHR